MPVLLLSLNLGAVAEIIQPSGTRIGFVPTAGDVYEDASFVQRDRRSLVRLGYHVEDIFLSGSHSNAAAAALASVDAVFLAGGNTFYLMQQLRLFGATAAMKALVAEGRTLIGASAGAVASGVSLEPIRSLDDPAAAPLLADDDGMNLVPFVPLPHAEEPLQDEYIAIMEQYGKRFDIMPVCDDQAIVVDGDGRHELIEFPGRPLALIGAAPC